MLQEAPTQGPRRGPQKGGTRRAFGRLRRLPSGRWQAAYTGPDGLLYKAQVTFEDEDAARGWLKLERKLIDLDEWTPPSERGTRKQRATVMFGDFATTWIANRRVKGQPLKPRTRAHYESLLEKQLQPTFGRRRLTAITPDLVRQWHDAQGNGTPTQTAHAYGLLRAVLADAVEQNVIAANPCHLRGASATKRAHKVQPLSVAELGVLVAEMPEDRQLMCLFAAWCALRFGELVELRRKDIDVKNATIKIRRGAVRTSAGFVVGTPKSEAGARDVAIPPHLVPAVRDHLAKHVDAGREALLFPAKNGGHLQPSTLYGSPPRQVKDAETGRMSWEGGGGFYRARAHAGRPQLHFHDLRHTGAVLAAQTGATLAELMARLGHSTPGAAMRYQHAAAGRDKAIAAALSRMAEA